MLDLANDDSAMLDNDEEEELVEELPEAEKKLDPLMHAKIKRTVNDEEHFGVVDEIEVGSVSKERLYRVQYEDGDLEHLTEAQVKECKVPALNQSKSTPAGKGHRVQAEDTDGMGAAAPNDGEDEGDEEEEAEEDEEEEEKAPPAKEARKSVAKKPAAARPSTLPTNKAKAKAAPAQAKGKVVTKVTKKPARA